MFRRVFVLCVCAAVMTVAVAAAAADLSGVVTDATGAPVSGAQVILRDLATGRESTVATASDGKYAVKAPAAGTYLLIVRRAGFAEAARTVDVAKGEDTVSLPVRLDVAAVSDQVTVTPARGERETRQIPLAVTTLSKAQIDDQNPTSTGQALTAVANVTPVGDGPFGVRPRLRGLDSTRVLVLVDGERLNTARLATGRAGAEPGLIAPDSVEKVEIVNGAGTVMYGSDALAGTINIVTNQPQFAPRQRAVYGFNGFFSSNENGRRGSVVLGTEGPRVSVRLQAGAEAFDNYKAGALTSEDTNRFFTTGQLTRTDTIDTNFGLSLHAFPDPFNAPYVRTSNEVLNSGAKANFVNVAAIAQLDDRQHLTLRYQARRASDIGFPDFADPYFFNAQTLTASNLDRFSARYELQGVTPWFRNFSVTARYQHTDRTLNNTLPVQFPAPAATFFPISVFRLDIVSDTRQQVWTPGVDVQAVFVPAHNHILTAGLTGYRDRSEDARTTATTTSMVGQVVLGARGPQAVVFPTPTVLGPAAIDHPVRVPNATLRNVGLFAQDEWRAAANVLVTAGVREDFYNVANEATPGYDVLAVVAGATPALSTTDFPTAGGASYARQALTGDLGVTFNPNGAVSPFVRYGRSYRHPNLEEMFFAGPATAGSIVPNVNVKPETGNNLDAGVKFAAHGVTGGAYVFLNAYKNFIAQDLPVASNSSGQIAQTRNFGDVRLGGMEGNLAAPIVLRAGVVTLTGSAAYLRGTIVSGTDPITGGTLADTPLDDITPFKFVGAARYTNTANRFWVEYGVRTQTKVNRVATTLLESPFLIAQDLLSLDGFTVHRIGGGVNLSKGPHQARLTVAVENLTNRYYREQFQFAPARGRSFTVGLSVGAF